MSAFDRHFRSNAILQRLRRGPATAAELADAASMRTNQIGPYINYLTAHGRVRRCDGKSGRGYPATYSLDSEYREIGRPSAPRHFFFEREGTQ